MLPLFAFPFLFLDLREENITKNFQVRVRQLPHNFHLQTCVYAADLAGLMLLLTR